MNTFENLKLKKQLKKAISDLGFTHLTPIQKESYGSILSGSDFVGIAQTGTGKTFAYLLPILQDLTYSEQQHPRVLILAPTRELVIQIVKEIEKLSPYISLRVAGVYGGSNNIKSQKKAVNDGLDIIVGTPRRLYDLILANVLRLKTIKKIVIDEVDIMLDFGYKTQLNHIFQQLPNKRQNIFFSATMTSYVDKLINDFLINPIKKTISVSGTPLENINQKSYFAPNFYTKLNLLNHLLLDKEEYRKVLIFVGSKKNGDMLGELLQFQSEISVIHSGKEQNNRIKSIEKFEQGVQRILVATDVISRGIDFKEISTVISFNTPFYPENYIHRIGRTGRAQLKGNSILLFNEKESALKKEIESLMNYFIDEIEFPPQIEVSSQLTAEEKDKPLDHDNEYLNQNDSNTKPKDAKKLAKNDRVKTKKKLYSKVLKERFKKPIRRGDKIQNLKKKNKKR